MRDTSALSTTKYSLSRRNVACETWETTCTSNRPKTGACSYKATIRILCFITCCEPGQAEVLSLRVWDGTR